MYMGDPEYPVCARLVLTGKFEIIKQKSTEWVWAQKALFQRHPSMTVWPVDHTWQIAAIRVQYAWLIDYFGGATEIELPKYYGVHQV